MARIHENTHNPILPLDVHVPDSEAHVMPDGKLYIYGSFDNRDDVYCSTEYHVVSTADMKQWTIYDVSLKGEEIEWHDNPDYPHFLGIDWEHPTPFIKKMLESSSEDKEALEKQNEGPKPPLLFAPDCLEKDGKYYLYFCMSDDTEGVAVSDRPEGPFTDWKQLPVGGIDPAIFVDDDGQAYYYWGQLFSHGAKLLPDMMTIEEGSQKDNLVTEEEHFFHEGSSMRKIGDTYYYVYASIAYGKPTSLSYATSKSPLGPFVYRGVIINNEECDPQSWNNHGSIEKFGDQWYVFYHRCSGNSKFYRRLCIEKIEILSDGTIPEVKMTSQGPGEPFGPGDTIMGYQACGVYGGCYIERDTEAKTECLTAPKDGGSAVFRYGCSENEFHTVTVTTRGRGKIKVFLGEELAGELTICGDGISSAKINAAGGCCEVRLEFVESDGLKLDSIVFA